MRLPLALALPLILAACESAQSSTAPPSPFVATAVGRVDSEEEARQLVAAADGVIEHVYVSRGQTVNAGQALLSVDCGPRVGEIAARRAGVTQALATARRVEEGARPEAITAAEADLASATSLELNQQQRLDTAKGLVERGFISRREFDARTNERDAAAASVAAARAKLDLLRNGSRASEIAEAHAATRTAAAETGVARAVAGQCVLRSPINGTVLQIMKREGEFSGASQGAPLIMVGDLSRLVVRAEINERDAARVRQGQAAQVWVDGAPERWRGRVTLLASMMGRRSARSLDPTDRFDRDVREAFIAFDGPPPPALVGLRVTVGLLK